MMLQGSYPVLMVESPRTIAAFYTRYFGFEETFDSEWYVSVRHPEYTASELAFLQHDHHSIPEGYATVSRGVLINFEVPDATSEYHRLCDDEGLTPLLPLRDEVFGQRHFILADAGGNMIDVIEIIPFDEEFAVAHGVTAT